jgi:hypothetical protein
MTGRLAEMLRSIEHPGGKVSVQYRCGDLEVMLVEVAGGAMVSDSSLCGRSAWHLVLDGQAVVTVGDSRWELLPEESLRLNEPAGPCTIANPSHDRLRLLSVVAAGDAPEREGAV